MKYHIKYNGTYVREMDYTYLVECDKADSVFDESVAMAIKQRLDVELEEVEE
jgi:hypothetical protein